MCQSVIISGNLNFYFRYGFFFHNPYRTLKNVLVKCQTTVLIRRSKNIHSYSHSIIRFSHSDMPIEHTLDKYELYYDGKCEKINLYFSQQALTPVRSITYCQKINRPNYNGNILEININSCAFWLVYDRIDQFYQGL